MRWMIIILATSLAATSSAFPAQTPNGSQNAEDVFEQLLVTSVEADRTVREYWTPERVASIDHNPSSPDPPEPVPSEERHLGAEYDGQGAVRKTVGRLLFTVPQENGTVDSSCTATLLQSANEATLVTAAHCMKETLFYQGQEWNANHLFLPGFRDNLPQRNFTVNRAFISSAHLEEDAPYGSDRAFIVLNPEPELAQTAGAALGEGQNIKFGALAPPYGVRYNMGYPRYSETEDPPRYGSPAFTGLRLAVCFGESVDWWRYPETNVTGFPCFMGGGSSGGPHLADFDTELGVGTVVAVNSIVDVERINGTIIYEYAAAVYDDFSKLLYETAQSVKPLLS